MTKSDYTPRNADGEGDVPACRRSAGWQSVGVIFSIGCFGLAAQTLLFRLFLTVFEGNELGIACFFGSWLAWVAVGALFARSRLGAMRILTDHFEFMSLLYLPAFVLQWWLLGRARELTGVERYEMFPLFTMLPVTFLANAPVSFCTGLLFTSGCRWLSASHGSPVAKVYTWECIGGFAGGVAVTVLLAGGVAAESLFLGMALLLTLALAAYRMRRGAYVSGALPVLAVVTALALGVAGRWERYDDIRTWRRVLPARAFLGRFTTPEAKYLYGECNGQFNVVSWETVTETIPNTEHASEVIALHLAQRPDARRFLVAGRGTFSLCKRLLALPQADAITWFDPDPAYAAHLLRVLPPRFSAGMERVEIPSDDIRSWLAQSGATYDMVILDFPDATTLALNRYFTREFFRLLKDHLNPSGAVGVRCSAGENYMSAERINAGASVFHTLRSVFTHIAIKPGEESWLIASDGPGLSSVPAVLRQRFAAIEGADRLYPPDGLLSLYRPARAEYQLDSYTKAEQGPEKGLLLNTEQTPRALLHGLLFAAREAGGGISLGRFIRTFAQYGLPVAPLGLLLFALLRTVFRLRCRVEGDAVEAPPSGFDSYALVLTTGAAGMGASMVLMYMYQSAFGSLFLHVGLLSALYMFGLSVGSAAAARFLRSARGRSAERFVGIALLLHVLLYGAIVFLEARVGPFVFAVAFVVSGLVGGVYIPVAARRLDIAGVRHDEAGTGVEFADHVGGAIGGLVTGLLVLPVFGLSLGVGLLALLLLTNAALFWPRAYEAGAGVSRAARRPARAIGYVLFGLSAFALAAGLLLHRGGMEEARRAFLAFARTAAGEGGMEARTQRLPDGRTLEYFAITGSPAETSYTFPTDALAPGIQGYGGSLALAAWVGADGKLIQVAVLPSRETPAYLAYLQPWLERLCGGDLFTADPLNDVDAVTGATVTSSAVLRILRQAGPAFARQVLGREVGSSIPVSDRHPPYRAGLWLAATAAVALFLRRRPSRRLRCVFLLVVVAVSGLCLNTQYSLAHVFSLLELKPPPTGWSTAFVLVLAVPVLVALLGNIYCGYLCPFGALQELVGELRPTWLRTDPDKTGWGRGRYVKYAILAVLVALFGATAQHALASGDPLVSVFSMGRSRAVLGAVIALAGLAFFYPRFWCRCLCPAGAFLSLLNGVRVFKRLVPDVVPRACVFGVRDRRDLDCLCCDRCRRPGGRERQALARPAGWMAPVGVNAWLLAAAVTLALLMVLQAASTLSKDTGVRRGVAVELPGRGARPVDMPRLQTLIQQGRLSNQEALFYNTTRQERASP